MKQSFSKFMLSTLAFQIEECAPVATTDSCGMPACLVGSLFFQVEDAPNLRQFLRKYRAVHSQGFLQDPHGGAQVVANVREILDILGR